MTPQATVLSYVSRAAASCTHPPEVNPDRDDANSPHPPYAFRWSDGAPPRLAYRPATITRFEPKPRTY